MRVIVGPEYPLSVRPRSAVAASRSLSVDITAELRFEMREALAQRRPSQWAKVWPTGVAVSRWLLEQTAARLPLSATELGCGVGLVSMTLAHMGLRIEGTDREPLALALALENAAANRLLGFTARLLDWGEPNVATTRLLVGSDVVYEREAPERLFTLVQTSGLLAPGGRFLLGAPSARTVFVEELVLRLVDEGYAHSSHVRVVAWEGQHDEIQVHVLERPEH